METFNFIMRILLTGFAVYHMFRSAVTYRAGDTLQAIWHEVNVATLLIIAFGIK